MSPYNEYKLYRSCKQYLLGNIFVRLARLSEHNSSSYRTSPLLKVTSKSIVSKYNRAITAAIVTMLTYRYLDQAPSIVRQRLLCKDFYLFSGRLGVSVMSMTG